MSVTFYAAGAEGRPLDPCTCDEGDWCRRHAYNLSSANALDLLRWLGLPAEEWGTAPAADVAAACRRRLWPEARNLDPAVTARAEGRVVCAGRREGYLRDRVEQLLELTERSVVVTWS